MEYQQYVLHYALSNGPWEQVPLEYGEYVMGRSGECDIILEETNISRRHARLEVGEDGLWIMDLGSANGTQLEGTPLPPRRKKPLGTGKVFTIVSFRLKVEAVGSDGTILPSDDLEVATRLDEGRGARQLPPVLRDVETKVDPQPIVPVPPAAPSPPAIEEARTRLDPVENQGPEIFLLVKKKDAPWERTILEEGEHILGRVGECDVVLEEMGISRQHAKLIVTAKGLILMDLGSANGTRIEQENLLPQEQRALGWGQSFHIGSYDLKVEIAGATESDVVPAPEREGSNFPTNMENAPDISLGDATKADAGAVEDSEAQTRFDAAPIPPAADQTRVEPSAPKKTGVRLRTRKEGGEWEERVLQPGKYIIGRSEDCDITLADAGVSRKHAQLEVHADACFITDLGSANGTDIGGRKLNANEKTPVVSRAVVNIFKFQLTAESLSQAVSATRPIPSAMETRVPGEPDRTYVAAGPDQTRTSAMPAASPINLRFRQGNGPWKEVPLREGEQFVGRGSECSVRVNSQMISRKHARIAVRGSNVWVADLGSKNGVIKGGIPIVPNQNHPLVGGDNFQIGEFTFELSGMPAVIPQYAPTHGDSATMVGGEMQGVVAPGMEMAQERRPLNLMGHERVTIGRAPDNQIVFNHPLISRYHAVLERMGTRTRLLDLHSGNGLTVNGQPVDEQTWLKPGDSIKVGPFQIQFTGNELRPSASDSYNIDVLGVQKWVTKSLNLLKEISLNVGQNEFVALVGMSGAGKSTLMDAINGFRPGTHGQVLVNGVDLYKNYGMFRDDIGNVPQKDIVHTELTADQALDYAAQLRMPRDTSRAERKAAVAETLEDLSLTFRKDVVISKLSGGQLKRVSIGVELLTKPRLFFLDEPTSGLDPGTEYEMMKLLRRLADQGRTVMLITHATKNVMFCDKVIILTTGGNLAFYGPPEYALEYFDQFRSKREQLEKDMEFDDIYRILTEPERGTHEQWRERFLKSEFVRYLKPQFTQAKQMQAGGRKQIGRRINAIRQFFILSARNLKCFFQDRATLGLSLALAPLLGLMNFMWGRNLFDPQTGDATKVLTLWFMTAIIPLLVGAMGSMREIVKENDIYKRERAVGLKILPYVLSKVWLGLPLAIYQAGALFFFLALLVKLPLPGIEGYVAIYLTMVLAIVCGYLLGLLVSAVVPNQNAAPIVLIAVLVPHFLLAGVLQPLFRIPLGNVLSPIVSSRWVFESYVMASRMGDPLALDACWQLPKEQRNSLTKEDKEICLCLGPQLFQNCAGIPGILSEDFYDDEARTALAAQKPVQPAEPEPLPTPTRLATPTYLPTPTYPPTPTPIATPTPLPINLHYDENACSHLDDGTGQYSIEKEACVHGYVSNKVERYRDDSIEQMDEYRATREAQFDPYWGEIEAQVEDYKGKVEDQIAEHVDKEEAGLTQFSVDSYAVFDDYSVDMKDYGEVLSDWERKRQEAIASAEAILGILYDNYGRAFKGTVVGRWFYIGLICFAQFIFTLIAQKRKDTI
jgi:ABC transport system ATP-binding/permease protein